MTLEEQYKQETGEDPFHVVDDGVYGKFLKRVYNSKYIAWLENKLDHYKRLAEAAEGWIKELEHRLSIRMGKSLVEKLQEVNKYSKEYNSILHEREARK